jgi:hypothetical protein
LHTSKIGFYAMRFGSLSFRIDIRYWSPFLQTEFVSPLQQPNVISAAGAERKILSVK